MISLKYAYTRYRFEKYGYDVRTGHQIDDLSRRIRALLPKESSGYQYVYQPAMTYLDTQSYRFSHVDEGLAIFSKLPIIRSSFIRLSRNFSDREDEHQRACLHAEINLSSSKTDQSSSMNSSFPSKTLHFFTTHMSLSHSSRRRNMMEILEFTESFSLPQVIVGDFNENPDTESLDFITGRLELDGKTGKFKDAWKVLKYQNTDGTYNEETQDDWLNGWTYTTLSEQPKKRIDFILYRGDEEDLMRLIDINVLSNDGLVTQPSDHRALYADFHV